MNINKQAAKKLGILFLKIFFSGLSIYLVIKEINVEKMTIVLQNVNGMLLLISFIFLNLAQFTSAYRLKVLLNQIDIPITFLQNLRLYYMGMFYNLFLPGGIGGDGIKALILRKKFGQSIKKIVSCLIIDRLSGLAGLAFLGCLGVLISNLIISEPWLYLADISLLLLVYPVFYLLLRFFFKMYHFILFPLSALGMAVNIVQTVSVIFCFLAIGTKINLTEYVTVFYFATAAMVFPFTIGGIGIRELVFMLAPKYMAIDPETGLSFCLMFFVMNALSSLAGIFIKPALLNAQS